jgi:hypothetical protein
MHRAAPLIAVTLCGCNTTLRVEIGARMTFDGDPVLRVGVSGGLGISPDSGTFSVTQSVGYRYIAPESKSVTATTRLFARTGPVFVSGAAEIDKSGFYIAPALAVPLHRTDRDPEQSRGYSVLSAGLQLRLGRDDGVSTIGADFVLGRDSLGGSFVVPR